MIRKDHFKLSGLELECGWGCSWLINPLLIQSSIGLTHGFFPETPFCYKLYLNDITQNSRIDWNLFSQQYGQLPQGVMGQILEQEAKMRNGILIHVEVRKGTNVYPLLDALHTFPSQTPGVSSIPTLKITNLKHRFF